MLPGDRVALTGANGTGKSTLVRRILETIDLPASRLTYLPQEIDLRSSREILEDARSQPSEILGRIMTAVSRLGSRPANLLNTAEPSPGELRKLLLALGIARKPYLIVMDEPTNHLDLPSIECLEEALAECPCGLLLVSHDEQLLRRLTRTRWHIVRTRIADKDGMLLQIR
jgi:ATPase subunit of ABC transporter with duplicated ATPase domains